MELQYYLVYLIVSIVCVAFAVTLIAHLNRNTGSDTENRAFRMMLIMYIVFLLCQSIWALATGNMLKISPFIANSIKLAGTVFIPIMVYYWFQFAEMRFENQMAYGKRFRLLTFIPLGIMLVIYLSNPATGLVAKVQPDGTLLEGPMIALTGIIDNLYGLAVVIHAGILFIRNKNVLRRRTYITHILFIAICTFGGIADAVLHDTPILPLAILLSCNVLFINLQESMIFNDALTGLNNKRRAEGFIRDAVKDASEKNPFCFILMDIDDFKTINEKHGHMGGDMALNITGDCLKESVEKRNGFLARWSGGGFAVILKTDDIKVIESFEDEVSQALEKVRTVRALPYDLTLSMGHEICTSGDRRSADVIDCADRKLYEAKAASDLM